MSTIKAKKLAKAIKPSVEPIVEPTVESPVAPKPEVEALMVQAQALATPAVSIELPEVDFSQKKTQGERTVEATGNQADFLPGTLKVDLPYIPEFVEDEMTGERRRLLRPQEYHYIWVQRELVIRYRANQYKFVLYNGGQLSGLAGAGFSHTGLFEQTADNHVMLGDCLLMY
ncbi:MAG: hypothetical protein ACRD2L_07575, partial [Terriglobia bacterium]